ncbi:MAG: hypothetical protein CL596_05005 [Alteromonas sp.]|mgnify:FL=1|nr:hypothetical protein [Alteromonas sp.]|tara:strand:- start:4654 stop:5286 length:633 start_codon:yes stop_codon:yes gene_type:complete
MKSKQIFIAGPSGSGKTTLANYISIRYRIPFIEGSSKPIWPEFNITSHLDIINRSAKDKDFAVEFQERLLYYRTEKLEGVKEFVTDRSFIDNLVYFTLQAGPHLNTESHNIYIEMCRESIEKYDPTILFLDINDLNINLENDNMRVNNRWFQEATGSLFRDYINRNIICSKELIVPINEWDWETRINTIDKLFDQTKENKWKSIIKKLNI